MSKEQAELEVGSPAQSSIYGKQDEYPTAYNLEAPEYLPCNNRRRDSGINNSRRFNKITAAWIAALLLCCAAAAVATYFALDFRDQARNCFTHKRQPTSPRPNATTPPLAPNSSCSNLRNATYTSAIDSSRFAAHCGTWYQGNNLLGVYVYTFEACMDACASYNSYGYTHNGSRCGSVTYDAVKENVGRGNCWLKSTSDIPAIARNVTDSAVLVMVVLE